MPRFPFMDKSSNEFPHASTADVWGQYRNDFDYSRWEPGVSIKLCNVPWDSDNENVVKFDDDRARDEWFDSIDSETVDLEALTRLKPDGSIRLPVPFDELVRYNYMRVDFGTATSPNSPIDYEHEHGVQVMHYFVDDVTSINPSVTECHLTPDWWTTYINAASIPMMMLNRGHWPVAQSDVDEYLKDPLNNSMYLLTDDIGEGGHTIVKKTKLNFPMDSEEKYLVFITDVSWVDPIRANGVSGQRPTYSDLSGYNGSRAGITVELNPTGTDYSNVTLTAPKWEHDSAVTGNCLEAYAVKANDAIGFIELMRASYAAYFNGIRAVYVCSANYLTLGISFKVGDYNLYFIHPRTTTKAIDLKREDFGFPSDMADFAKLYTYPYSELEWTSNDGFSTRIRVENCTNLRAVRTSCLAFPWFRVDTWIDGAGGKGATNFTIRALTGGDVHGATYNGDYIDTMIRYDIPTFEVSISARDAAAVDRAWDNAGWEYRARANYVNGATTANTTYFNTKESAQFDRDNAHRTADTGKSNADASADMGKSNADALANTSVTNAANQNSTASTITGLNNGASTNVTNRNNKLNNDVNYNNEALRGAVSGFSDAYTRTVTSDKNDYAATVNAQSNGAAAQSAAWSAASSLISGAAIGALGGPAGAVIGAGVSAANSVVGAGINIQTNNVSTMATIATNAGVAEAAQDFNRNVTDETNTTAGENTQYGIGAANDIRGILNELATGTTNASNNLNTNNTANNANTSKSNATRTRDTTKANASRTQSTTKTNADNTQAVINANSQRVNDVDIARLQRTTNAEYDAALAQFNRANLEHAARYGTFTGTPEAGYENRAAHELRVRTMPLGRLQPIADYFKRYGYAWNGQVNLADVNALKCMEHFSYWEASEVWVNGDTIVDDARKAIEGIIKNGVTVWANPSEIGAVSINANNR